jgi:hypothetical protein
VIASVTVTIGTVIATANTVTAIGTTGIGIGIGAPPQGVLLLPLLVVVDIATAALLLEAPALAPLVNVGTKTDVGKRPVYSKLYTSLAHPRLGLFGLYQKQSKALIFSPISNRLSSMLAYVKSARCTLFGLVAAAPCKFTRLSSPSSAQTCQKREVPEQVQVPTISRQV